MADTINQEHFETREFQAEVKQLLDIVVNSLYTDREIFLRELISNAADALEKFRYENLTHKEVANKDELSLEITIEVDEEKHLLTITDTGIGMTREELIENLGTIAHSGSKNFVQQMAEGDRKDLNLIGQFGVGFYAVFMVAGKIRVLSRSYIPEAEGCEWVSEGVGSYSISPVSGLKRGTKIILELREDASLFNSVQNIKDIIRQYSNFVSFPIKVNGEQVNTIQAVWTKNKSEVTDAEYVEFYKFVANVNDEPLYFMHYTVDAPLAIVALLFVPKQNIENFGLGRFDPGVNFYCRKVLIKQHAEELLPEWLRFVRGVVDSEDVPLNISRETMQDSSQIARLRRVITGRFLKFLNEQAQKDPERYAKFWESFGVFLKEGIVSGFSHREELAKLLRFETSKSEPGKLVSLADYIGRMKEDQQEIYFINGPNRKIIEAGPYLEVFRASDLEVIYTHEPLDDFVLSSLMEYEGKKLVSADLAELKLPALEDKPDQVPVDHEAVKSLNNWLKEILGDKVSEVRESSRLVDCPAIILNPDGTLTSSMERVMLAMNENLGEVRKKILEINPRHKLIQPLSQLHEANPGLAKVVAEQLYDNALIAAGLGVDLRTMVERTYDLMGYALGNQD